MHSNLDSDSKFGEVLLKSSTPEDLEALIHELHTHRIELQAQNEELKRVENELKISLDRYSDLYDFAPIGYLTFDIDGIIMEVNLTGANILGIERSFLIKKSFTLYLNNECKDIFYQHLKKVFNTQSRQICSLKTIDGKKNRYIKLESILVVDSEKNFQMRSAMSDITDLKKSEIELRKKEEELEIKEKIEQLKDFYENIVETIIEGLWEIDSNGKTCYVNKQLADMLGYNQNELLNRPFFDFIDVKYVDHAKKLFERRKQGIKERYDTRFVRKDGSVIWVTVSASPIIKNNQFTGAIGLVTDIMERKRIEDELKESEERYRTIVEYSNDMIWALDTEGKFTFFNKRAEKLSGYNFEEWKGKSFSPLISEEELPKVIDAFHRVLAGQSLEYEVTFVNKFNKRITLSVNTTPIYSKGRVVGTTSFGRDITEQKKAEIKIKEKTEELKRSNIELEQFAYIVSHDLQEPLRSISGFTEILARRYKNKLDPEADQFITYVINGSKRMQQMINDILALSRVGTKTKEFLPAYITDVLDSVFINLRLLIEKNNAIITYDKMPIVNVDKSQFVQLFQNLVENAIKFRKKDVIPKIHISAKKEKNEWIFSVQDNGIGIDPKNFHKLFIIFQRLHSRNEYEGTGIGLAICRKIVERHKGKIWVESELGKGSTFRFSIPTNLKNNAYT